MVFDRAGSSHARSEARSATVIFDRSRRREAMASDITLILAGALAGGFVNGLTGFGTALTAMPFWLQAVPPAIAAQLAAAGGAIGQLQTLPAIWHAIDWRRVAPFILAGLAGVPLGTWLLPHVSIRTFKLGVGIVLVAYCSLLLLTQRRFVVVGGGRLADVLVGLGGGFLRGLAGLSGPLPTIWASLKTWGRDEKRALFQTFNFAILSAMLAASAVAGLMTMELLRALLIALPGTIAGARFGGWVYKRLDVRRFDRLVLCVLMASGLALIWPLQ
jgi:uncharacterized protein